MQHLLKCLRHGTRLSVYGQTFYQLAKQSSDISAYTLRFQNCGDIHPMKFPKAPNTQILWFQNCDKNFLYYWLDPHLWPQLQYCILDTRIISDLYRWMPHVFPQTTFFIGEHEFRSRHMIPCDRYVRVLDADWINLEELFNGRTMDAEPCRPK